MSRNRLDSHAHQIDTALRLAYPEVHCALVHSNAFQLLVATILSAQCTDVRVNLVTPALFARFPTAFELAKAELTDVEELIRSTGFFRAKAKNLVAAARKLVELHGGEVPRDLEALTKLPGVGRKTANVVLGTAYGIPSGIVVDTHVKRLSTRMGLTESKTPEAIEQDLIAKLPSESWIDFSHRLITHGRAICSAQNPKCSACSLETICPKIGVKSRGETAVRKPKKPSESEAKSRTESAGSGPKKPSESEAKSRTESAESTPKSSRGTAEKRSSAAANIERVQATKALKKPLESTEKKARGAESPKIVEIKRKREKSKPKRTDREGPKRNKSEGSND
jgi:endonuclease-3